LRPVAAADYFLRNRWVAWCSTRLIGILPISRRPKVSEGDPLEAIDRFLAERGIVVLFPEGTRTLSGELGELRSGVAHLSRRHPDVPIVPIYVRGLNIALPKGEALFVPFFCDLFIGESLRWSGEKTQFMEQLEATLRGLEQEALG
jgi:1-acyl-sn-glycerol-3-phosphate acyltransferase